MTIYHLLEDALHVPWAVQASVLAGLLLLSAGLLVRRTVAAKGGGIVPDDGVTLRNVLEVLELPGLPCVVPLTVYCALDGALGAYEFRLRCLRQDGGVFHEVVFPDAVASDPFRPYVLRAPLEIEFRHVGRFEFQVVANGQVAGAKSLAVFYRPRD